MPGRIEFHTTPDCSGSAAQAMRISSNRAIYMYGLSTGGASTDINIDSVSQIQKVSSSRACKECERAFSIDSSVVQRFPLKEWKWKPSSGSPCKQDFGMIVEDIHPIMPCVVNLSYTRVNDIGEPVDACGDPEPGQALVPSSFRTQPLLMLAIAELQRHNELIAALDARIGS
jgi:hypothetical protein